MLNVLTVDKCCIGILPFLIIKIYIGSLTNGTVNHGLYTHALLLLLFGGRPIELAAHPVLKQ